MNFLVDIVFTKVLSFVIKTIKISYYGFDHLVGIFLGCN